jgi:hypothetical protein
MMKKGLEIPEELKHLAEQAMKQGFSQAVGD